MKVNELLLDTHYWIWFQTGNSKRLGPRARQELTEAQRNGALFISSISVLEVARLDAGNMLQLGMTVDRFVEEAECDGGLIFLPLSHRVLIESTRLPGTIHRDPSDRLLVATAREHGMELLTQDEEILSYAAQGHLNARKL